MKKNQESTRSVLARIFGQLSWRCPPWMNSVRQKAVSHPLKFSSQIIVLLAALGAAIYAAHWYVHLPKPELVTAMITTPKVSDVEDDKLIPDSLAIDFGIQKDTFSKQSVAPISLAGKAVSSGVTLTPDMNGQWRWDSDSRLVFTPATDWPAGQTYKITFTRDFFAPGAKMQSLNYDFSTLPLTTTISDFKFYQDPINPKERRAVATLRFNYPVDEASLGQQVSLVWQHSLKEKSDAGNKQLKYTLTFDKTKRTAFLNSENIELSDKPRYLFLNVKKGLEPASKTTQSTENTSSNLFVPDSSNYFKINGASVSIIRNDKDQPEQILNLEAFPGISDADLGKGLHVYLLPVDRPATAWEKGITNYAWQNPGEVTQSVLSLSSKAALQAMPADRNFATLHSFRIDVKTPRFLYIKIDKGTRSFGGFTLARDYEAVVQVPELPREITFLHKGSLLSVGSEKKISVLVRGLSAVKFKIARMRPENINQLVTQTQGNFNSPWFINESFNEDNISELYSEIQHFDDNDPGKQQYTNLDLSKYLAAESNASGPQGLFLLQAIGWDNEHNQALDIKSRRMILVTDLGLLVKDNSDGSHDVFVQSISLGGPVAGIEVSVLGKNGLPVLSRTTDDQGRASFPGLKDFIDDKEPVVYLARKGSDVSFIPFNNNNRQLNYSRFDIGGIYNNQDLHSLSAYVFSDRGIYRPGDTAHFGMIVKQAFARSQPAGLPLQVTITDARGSIVFDQKYSLNQIGLLTQDFATQVSSPTGQYTLNLYTVKDENEQSLLGSTTFKVEEFQPDRMRIKASLSAQTKKGWISPADLVAEVSLWNLYGTPAEDRRVSGKLVLIPKPVSFDEFPDYVFADPLVDPDKPPKTFTDTLKDAKTNSKGEAQFDLHLERFDRATWQLTFYAEGFEAEGGRSVTGQVSALVSPLPWFVGYKADGDLHFIKQQGQRQVSFIAVNPELQQLAVSDLTLQYQSLHPVTTLIKKEDGTYQYQSVIQTTIVSSKPFQIEEKGSTINLPTDETGDFALVLLDKNNKQLSKVAYRVVGESQKPLAKNAELTVSLDKDTYLPGEDIQLQITAPYTGGGLISIERDKTYATQWFKTDKTSSVQTIKIPADFQGDGYINVAFVRDWNSPDIFISPLSYAVIPFSMNHDADAVHISLEAPKLAAPGDNFTIRYSSDKPGKILVFAVDEGILQVSRYITPDPLAFFFQKHALEVLTQQTLDQILPNFIKDRELSSVGGDGSEEMGSARLNPFKRKTDLPVVYWSDVQDSDTTPRELTFNIPDYFNGSLRVMAVAVSDNAVGATEDTAVIRGPFVISPAVPTFVAPGDEFEVTASIANNIKESGDAPEIGIDLSTSPELEIIGPSHLVKTIGEGREQTVSYRLRAKQVLGSATLNFIVNMQNKTSSMKAALSVRPANSFLTTVTSGSSHSARLPLPVDRKLYPDLRKVEAAVSSSPLILVGGLQRYLDNYPFGCTEQLTSKALPVLAMANYPWFGTDVAKARNNVNTTIAMLAQRQMSSGAFSYWPSIADNSNNAFVSVYAMQFLTMARAQNYSVSNEMFYAGLAYLRELASQTPNSLDSARLQAYAIYVLTRNEIVTTNYLVNLQRWLEERYADVWQKDISGAYLAATYQLLKNQTEADRLIRQYKADAAVTSDFFDKDNANAQYLYLLANHFPQLAEKHDDLALSLVSAINSGEISTVFSGFASMALGAYGEVMPVAAASALTIEGIGADNKSILLAKAENGFARADIAEGISRLEFGNPDKQAFFYQLMQSGFDLEVSDKVIKNGMEIYREYRSLQNSDVIDKTELGSEIEVHIVVRALSDTWLNNIAIVDLLPGGFEVVSDSLRKNQVDYADIREDRVVFFTGFSSETKEIVYRIKATNVGEYSVPGIMAQSMYNPAVVARGEGGKMVVTRVGS